MPLLLSHCPYTFAIMPLSCDCTIYTGNKAAAQDTEFLLSQGVTHLLNCSANPGEPDIVRPDVEALENHGVGILQLKVGWNSTMDMVGGQR